MSTLNVFEKQRIKQSIGSLEASIQKIYGQRKVRQPTGPDGVLIRTLGIDYPQEFESLDEMPKTYVDSRKGETLTEIAELDRAIREYEDMHNSPMTRVSDVIDSLLEAVMEASDIYTQKRILETVHRQDDKYIDPGQAEIYYEFTDHVEYAIRQIDSALDALQPKLDDLGVSMELVEQVAASKYGLRCSLRKKDTQSEKEFARDTLMENSDIFATMLTDRIYRTIRGEGIVWTDELGALPHGKEPGPLYSVASRYPVGFKNISSIIEHGRSLGGYFTQMADKLEEFILGNEINPIQNRNMWEVHTEITEKIKSLQKFEIDDKGHVHPNMTDGTNLQIQTYWRLVAEYVAFEQR